MSLEYSAGFMQSFKETLDRRAAPGVDAGEAASPAHGGASDGSAGCCCWRWRTYATTDGRLRYRICMNGVNPEVVLVSVFPTQNPLWGGCRRCHTRGKATPVKPVGDPARLAHDTHDRQISTSISRMPDNALHRWNRCLEPGLRG